jgi:hypothetical protein
VGVLPDDGGQRLAGRVGGQSEVGFQGGRPDAVEFADQPARFLNGGGQLLDPAGSVQVGRNVFPQVGLVCG